MKKRSTKKPPLSAKRRPKHELRVYYVARHVEIDIDISVIAEHLPKFKLKDLVVLAMAMGGKARMPQAGSDSWRFVIDLPVTEMMAGRTA